MLEIMHHEVGQLRKQRASAGLSGEGGAWWKAHWREGGCSPLACCLLPIWHLEPAPHEKLGVSVGSSCPWPCLAATSAPCGRELGNPSPPGLYAPGWGMKDGIYTGNYPSRGWASYLVSMLSAGGPALTCCVWVAVEDHARIPMPRASSHSRSEPEHLTHVYAMQAARRISSHCKTRDEPSRQFGHTMVYIYLGAHAT